MNGDFSEVVGTPDLIEIKKGLFSHMHQGFADINDAKVTLEKDIKLLIPVLDEIEDHVNTLIQENRTVVIKDSSFFDNENEMKQVANTLKAIDPQN
ncbi:hypothetical protein VHTUMSATKI_11770 [Vibrio harveyi]|uniref:hypothetical protein n=1 Tax=Vibrio harveyi TaxID=669 RepID=UPI0036F2B87C